jgi:hypothetical protein
MIAKSQTEFFLGQLLITPGALEALQKAGLSASEFLQKHAATGALFVRKTGRRMKTP